MSFTALRLRLEEEVLHLAVRFATATGHPPTPPPLEIERFDFPSVQWPEDYEPLVITSAGDLHIGNPLFGLEELDNVVGLINDCKPDLNLWAGDYLNNAHRYNGGCGKPAEIARVAARVNARFGSYGVLGNHDHDNDGPGMAAALGNAGIGVLENEAVLIRRKGGDFWLVGVGDYSSGHQNLTEAFSRVNGKLPVVALAHNPYSIYGMPMNPVITFSGHTHGHQFKIPGISRIPGCPDNDLDQGLKVREGRTVHITTGLGYSLYPIRNVQPRFTVCQIMTAKKSEAVTAQETPALVAVG
jgi:uncharacterized protein